MASDAAAMIIFDDGRSHLGPMTDLRAAFEVRSGMHTTARRLAGAFPRMLSAYWVPPRLAPLVAQRADAPVNQLPGDELILCVNGRLALPDALPMPEPGEAVIESGTDDIVAACLRRADAEYMLRTGTLGERVRRRSHPSRVLYRFPWDLIAMLEGALRYDLDRVVMPDAQVVRNHAEVCGGYAVGADVSARIMPGVTFDAELGPVYIGPRATIRPGSVIIGPAAIHCDAVVLDRAVIRPGTVVGPACKVAGEVSMTIMQGRSNKAHDGFVGHTWIGKWVNLGAGTVTSNLLNTYSPISMRIDVGGARHRTGQTFLGAILGDHVKTAIQTRLMTGSCIGTGSMLASTAAPPATVGPFTWLTDDGIRTFRLEKFLETMHAVMGRRGIIPDPVYIETVTKLHQQVAAP